MPGKQRSTDGKVFLQILGKRQRGDKIYYKVQWKGQRLHTWELEENLSPRKVVEFEEKKQNISNTVKRFDGNVSNLKPEKILGIYQVDDERMFMMKWKGSSPNVFIPEAAAKIQFPQEVIAFYETKIVWV